MSRVAWIIAIVCIVIAVIDNYKYFLKNREHLDRHQEREQ